MESQEPFDPIEPEVTPQYSAWLAPAKLPDEEPVPRVRYDLRPLSMGEVLDRTFSVYRSNFLLFAGISAVPGIFQSIAASAQIRFQNTALMTRTGLPDLNQLHFGAAFAWMMAAYVMLLLTLSQSHAVTAFAVGEVYLGRTTTIAEAFHATRRRWLSYIGIGIWQTGSMFWIPLALVVPGGILIAVGLRSGAGWAALGGVLLFFGGVGGLVLGYIQYLKNSLAVPAAVLEQLKVRAAMRRSKTLSNGAKWRVFVVILITSCMYLVVGVLETPLTMMTQAALKQGKDSIPVMLGMLALSFLGHAVVTPVMLIGETMLYFDQRVRLEAFDIAMLLGEETAVEVSAEPGATAVEGAAS